jgi:ABC-2 type transport system permease protein
MHIFFLSGALFPLAGLPPLMRAITRIDPLSYGVDGLRSALTGVSHFGVPTDLFVLTTLSIATLLVGSYLFSKIQL